MILHKLIARHFRHRDDPEFYRLQARDAVRWISESGLQLGPNTRALDLGCGHGVFGGELKNLGCKVTFADEENFLLPDFAACPFQRINLDKDPLTTLGEYDLVICSNVYEHLSKPAQFLDGVHTLISGSGALYLSWTNWLSPWGGHEFSPFHYLGSNLGPRLFDRLRPGQRKHFVHKNLFPTFIGSTLRAIRANPKLRVIRAAPRYYSELSFLVNIPVVREFFTWNCALLIGRKS